MQRDWWKWGDSKEIKHITDYPKLKIQLEERWKTNLREDFFPPKKFELPVLTEKKKIPSKIFLQRYLLKKYPLAMMTDYTFLLVKVIMMSSGFLMAKALYHRMLSSLRHLTMKYNTSSQKLRNTMFTSFHTEAALMS